VAVLPAYAFHYWLWRFWQPAWAGPVLLFWIIGFPIGWALAPYFVSRQRRYLASPARQFGDRIMMGIAVGGGLGLLAGLISTELAR
jgi:hypothetical protein